MGLRDRIAGEEDGRRIQGAQSLKTGDTITLGTSDIVFELEQGH